MTQSVYDRGQSSLALSCTLQGHYSTEDKVSHIEELFDGTKRWRSFVCYRWHSCPVIRFSWQIGRRHFIFRANYWRHFFGRDDMDWKQFLTGRAHFLDIMISYHYGHFTLQNIIIQMRPTIFVQEQISMLQWTSEIFTRNCYTFRT